MRKKPAVKIDGGLGEIVERRKVSDFGVEYIETERGDASWNLNSCEKLLEYITSELERLFQQATGEKLYANLWSVKSAERAGHKMATVIKKPHRAGTLAAVSKWAKSGLLQLDKMRPHWNRLRRNELALGLKHPLDGVLVCAIRLGQCYELARLTERYGTPSLHGQAPEVAGRRRFKKANTERSKKAAVKDAERRARMHEIMSGSENYNRKEAARLLAERDTGKPWAGSSRVFYDSIKRKPVK